MENAVVQQIRKRITRSKFGRYYLFLLFPNMMSSTFLNVKQLSCASCTSNTQIHNLREKGQEYGSSDISSDTTVV